MTTKGMRLSKDIKRDLESIAIRFIYAVDKRGGLDTRMDGSDYIETSVGSIRAILEEAYKMGIRDAAKQ